MKLRIQANSVRVRLTQGEVRTLAQGQGVEQTTRFSPASAVVTRIETAAQTPSVAARFDGRRLTLSISLELVRRWADTEEVGIEGEQSIGEDQWLHILIEKDFECLHSGKDQNIDVFPNPRRLSSANAIADST